MKGRTFVASAALACMIAPAAMAQSEVDPRCTDPALVGASNEGQDACQKAIDLLNYMTPQLGTLIAGGNATIGRFSALAREPLTDLVTGPWGLDDGQPVP